VVAVETQLDDDRAGGRRREVVGKDIENFQCRLEVYVQHACTQPVSMQPYLAKGTEGLRVVDASVIPYVTNGNIYALAEMAADLILGNTPLPPGSVDFYRI
jgi:hypothetical protein